MEHVQGSAAITRDHRPGSDFRAVTELAARGVPRVRTAIRLLRDESTPFAVREQDRFGIRTVHGEEHVDRVG